jgi:hypothetical protein
LAPQDDTKANLVPTLGGTVKAAAPGLHGFDTNTVLTAQVASAFRQQGFAFCVRYLSPSSPQAGGDLSAAEAQAILGSGLALMAVQHVSKAEWAPTEALGSQFGAAAAQNAQTVGFPPGVNIWRDLEGVRSGVANEDVIAYCNAWFDAVSAVQYQPGIYVGSDCILTGDDLFWRLRTHHYWRSGSSYTPDIPHRGYQLVQRITSAPDVGGGIAIDRDITMPDALNGSLCGSRLDARLPSDPKDRDDHALTDADTSNQSPSPH